MRKDVRKKACLISFISLPCLFSFLANAAEPAIPAGMEQAIRAAMQTHPDVMAADSQMLSAHSQVQAGDYRWFPRAEVSARTGKSGDRYSVIGLQQTLWDAGRLNADYEAVKANEQAALSGKSAAMETIGMAAANAYLNLARAREQLQVAEENVKEHRKLHFSVLKRSDGGIGSKSDVTLAISRLQQARAAARQWQGEVGRAEAAYLSVIGTEAPVSQLQAPALWEVENGRAGVIARVNARSPSLQKLREEVRVAEAVVDSKKAQLYPSLYARIDNTRYFGDSPVDNDTRFSINFEWQNDVALSQRYQIESAQHQVMAARRALESEGRRLTEAASSYWDDYMTAINRTAELDQFAASADETVQLFKRQFTIGRRSWPEVMNSLQDLYAARNQKVDARYAAMASRMRLAFLGGEMDGLLGLRAPASLQNDAAGQP
ncbi:MAG: hypothetical protein RL194_715 [Pseudomonadota bacterium]|jgi:adhesin transport system outer membrane protein